jgi:hypothetical protein
MTEAEEVHLFHPWGGVIAELAQCGVICFKVQEEKAYRLCPAFTPMNARDAQLELAQRYFTHYGPATLRDAAYFFGVPQTQVKGWLKELDVQSFQWEGRTYYHLPCSIPQAAVPRVIFLAGFDQLMLGYRKEDNPFLPQEHLRRVFNLTGIVHPVLLLDGCAAGTWKYKSGKLTLSPFTPLEPALRSLILNSAESLWQLRKVTWE